MRLASLPEIVMVSSPSRPYDVGEIYEIRVTAARSQRVPSINVLSAAERALPPRPFQTLISHEDVRRTVALNRDGVIASTSLRRRGYETRVTAARSQRIPSINFLSAAGRALLPRPFQTLILHVDAPSLVTRNRDGVLAINSLRRRGDLTDPSHGRTLSTRPARDCIVFLSAASAAGRALPPRLPDTGFARRCTQHSRP